MIVTHDAKVAAQGERVLMMEDGRIIDELYLGKFTGEELDKSMEKVNERILTIEVSKG